MKKIMLVAALMLSLSAIAQESFPAKHPDLLKGKDVKVIATHESEISGYSNFYSDSEMTKTYMPSKKNYDTDTKSLLGKQFKVVEVDSLINPYQKMCRVTIVSADGAKIYYKYDGQFDIDYPFEVVGGLTLPEGFYCDYITKEAYGSTVVYNTLIGRGIVINKRVELGKASYTMGFSVFGPKDTNGPITKVTLLLENNKTIVDTRQMFYSALQSEEYKYSFTIALTEAQVQLLIQNKIKNVRAGELDLPFQKNLKLQGVLKCMQKLK
ncbi:hypothetical protein [Flavobacterium psychrotrophum]|uniref:hypothetical protein n=1 Tax=Flavobacterium psychrotrophum TaxID=2294119 RepID=UPI000E3169B1|nr:hypothetical protein [Flavobacterium psychrotrophum]